MGYIGILDGKNLTSGGARHSGRVDSRRVGSNFGGCTEKVVGTTEKTVPGFKVMVGAACSRHSCRVYRAGVGAPATIDGPVGADCIREYPWIQNNHLWERRLAAMGFGCFNLSFGRAGVGAPLTVGRVKEQSDVPDSVLNKAVCWVR